MCWAEELFSDGETSEKILNFQADRQTFRGKICGKEDQKTPDRHRGGGVCIIWQEEEIFTGSYVWSLV